MSNLDRLNYSFRYFVSKGDQALSIMVPVANPTVFKLSHRNTGEIGDFSTEEEILPDFKCEKCSVRILSYSELKTHQQDHENAVEERIEKSHFPVTDQVEGFENTNYVFKSSNAENLKNGSMFHHLKYGFHLGTTAEGIYVVPKKEFPSETALNPLHEGDKRHSSSNRIVASFKNYNSNLHTLKVSDCSESKQPVQLQNTMLGTEFKKPNLLKLPLMQKLNYCSSYVLTFNASNSDISDLSPTKDNFEVNSELTENISVTNKLNSPEILQEGNLKRKNISAAESSTLNSAPTFTYADPKGLLTPIKRKKNVPIVKTYSDFSRRHKLMLNTKANTDLGYSNFNINFRENRSEVKQTMGKLNGSFPTLQTQVDKSRSTVSIYSKKEISKEVITKNKTTGYYESRSSDIKPLQSMDVYDHSITIVQQLTEAKDKDEVNLKKKAIVNGIFPGTFSEKGIHGTMDNFSDFMSTYQQDANLKVSGVSSYSKYEMYTEKSDRHKTIQYDDRSPLKISVSQTVDVNERGIYILEPLTNAKEKPFRCFYCRKIFESSFYMRKHFLEHKETKTDFCALCCSFFTRRETFREHILIVHCQAKEQKQCPYCDYRYFRKTNFENHIASRHATRDFGYKCKNCIQEFETLKDLNKHIARKHFNRNFEV